jgi:hypothetical protein
MFEFDVLELNDSLEIQERGNKIIYNTDNLTPASEWVREPLKGMKTYDAPQMTSALLHKHSGRGSVVNGYLGYMISNSNNVYKSGQGVSIGSSTFAMANGLSIHPSNLFRCLSLFSARRIVKGDWKNWYDEYITPNEEHEQFEQFKYDSLVYSLFESKSNQSSLRQIEYKGRLWDIKNEFFWMSADRMKTLADNMGYDELYNDARTSPDRHVYKLLFGPENIYEKLSPDAKAVLDKATELVELSMEMRQVMANDENHLNSWDAGYAQLKLVWKEYFPEQFKEFRQLYKNMEDRMRPLVYELGFLMK